MESQQQQQQLAQRLPRPHCDIHTSDSTQLPTLASALEPVAEASGSPSAGAVVPATSTNQPRCVVKPQGIPDDIVRNAELNAWVAQLPRNYEFEVHKTIWRLRQARAKKVALQFPEGLLMYALPLSEILSRFAGVTCVVLGDVAYGACCVDDLAAHALQCDFLVHYGHSCLVSIKDCVVRSMMYVFVEIRIDVAHLVAVVRQHFAPSCRLAMIATIQFVNPLRVAAEQLRAHFATPVLVPQVKPLSAGELLGCTSPTVDPALVDSVLYLGDGRFHLESFMIANPRLTVYKYDPYTKILSLEGYDYDRMVAVRRSAIEQAREARVFGLILGTLGRQGRVPVMERVWKLLQQRGRVVVPILLSEVTPAKLALFPDIDAFVQVACPRLSIDWGAGFSKPLLTPYEAEVCLGEVEMFAPTVASLGGVGGMEGGQGPKGYAMDYYAKAGGPWAAYTPKP